MVKDTLLDALEAQPEVDAIRRRLEPSLDSKETTATLGAQAILSAFKWP